MGYYIPNNIPIEDREGVERVNFIGAFNTIPKGKALIVSVNNGSFKAYALAYSQDELNVFNNVNDFRPKNYYLMDKETAHRLSNYK